jgi:hypothetical protein
MLTVTNAECHIEAPNAECHYAECRYAECRGALSSTDETSISITIFIKTFTTVIYTVVT